MDRVMVLLRRSEGTGIEAFNAALRDRIAAWLGSREGVHFLSLHLVDEEARGIPLALDVTRPPAFDALLELATDDPSTSQGLLEGLPPTGGRHAYRVRQRHVKQYPRTWPDGQRTPGVFLVSAVYRAASLDHESFDEHWRERHRPLALRHHVGMWDYRQNPVQEVLTPGSPPFDGIAHMGFPSVEAFRTGQFDSREGVRIIMADTERFLALERSEAAIMGEYILRS